MRVVWPPVVRLKINTLKLDLINIFFVANGKIGSKEYSIALSVVKRKLRAKVLLGVRYQKHESEKKGKVLKGYLEIVQTPYSPFLNKTELLLFNMFH